ncbi:hypothetical protein GCM10010439_13960 [Actinocorallia aurantiaca]|uniref:Uncharacterized protein n=1 Tax=Actinocorallia aurantiaca TaxID=46204 RepID=A0ABP6GE72_9ACTN
MGDTRVRRGRSGESGGDAGQEGAEESGGDQTAKTHGSSKRGKLCSTKADRVSLMDTLASIEITNAFAGGAAVPPRGAPAAFRRRA